MSALGPRERQQIAKLGRLTALERKARKEIPRDQWATVEARKGMEEYCLLRWAVGESTARHLAKIVQLRLVEELDKTAPQEKLEPNPLPVEQEEKMDLFEIIADYRSRLPPPPTTDFEVHEEKDE